MRGVLRGIRRRVNVYCEGGHRVKVITGTRRIADEYPDILRDESSLSGGSCQVAAWPGSIEEVSGFLRECREDRVPVTVSGARTGVAGGAVPMGGALLCTERLRGLTPGEFPGTLKVMAGETIEGIRSYCRENLPDHFYPPDPTETTASVGGTLATDASGASSYRYGSTRHWVNAIDVVLPGGTQLKVRRGEHRFRKGRLSHPVLGKLQLPEMERTRFPKNAAGLFIEPGMDLIDLFIGSEGELGVICGAELRLGQKPYATASLAVFCTEEQFWVLRNDLMESSLPVRELEAMLPPCLDFLNENHGAFVHPPGDWVLITSIEAEGEDDLDRILETLDVMLSERGVSPDSTWGGFDEAERERLREFRHGLPETVNRIVARNAAGNPSIHKISTDTAVPRELLRDYHGYMVSVLRGTGVPHVVFGHAGQGHLHANLLPKNHDELQASERAVELLARRAVLLGGTVSAEHGTGRLKKHLLECMYSQKELQGMELLKERLRAL